MQVLSQQMTVGHDKTLHMPLPAGLRPGRYEVVCIVEYVGPLPTQEQREEAIAGDLSLASLSVEEFLEERRQEDRRRDEQFGV